LVCVLDTIGREDEALSPVKCDKRGSGRGFRQPSPSGQRWTAGIPVRRYAAPADGPCLSRCAFPWRR